jgi:engulfment/cell motility protein 1
MIFLPGINILIGQKMTSRSYQEELNLHVSLEVRMQLLELDGLEINIPDIPPVIPADPTDYNFYYK